MDSPNGALPPLLAPRAAPRNARTPLLRAPLPRSGGFTSPPALPFEFWLLADQQCHRRCACEISF